MGQTEGGCWTADAFFVYPTIGSLFLSFTLIGTTDVAYEGDPRDVSISSEEVAYLCATVNDYFATAIAPEDVRWTYAGVRPLSDDEAANASKVTRDYRLELTAAPYQPAVLSVFGGKITTYRRLAESALEKLHPFIGGSKQPWTDRSSLPGGDLPRRDFALFLNGVRQRWPFLPENLAYRLARAYGTRISDIVGSAKTLEELGAHFGAGLTRAEVDYLRNHEWAQSADDILWRRTKLGLHMSAAERESLACVFDDARTVLRLALLQLDFQRGIAARGHRNLFHHIFRPCIVRTVTGARTRYHLDFDSGFLAPEWARRVDDLLPDDRCRSAGERDVDKLHGEHGIGRQRDALAIEDFTGDGLLCPQ